MSSTGVQDFAVGTVCVSKLSMMLGLQAGVTGRILSLVPYISVMYVPPRERHSRRRRSKTSA